jgi:hypothetical protein
MTEFNKNKIGPWTDTLIAPVIVGLVSSGVTYSFMPNALGIKLATIISISVLIIGIVIVTIRIKKNKGPATLHPRKKS